MCRLGFILDYERGELREGEQIGGLDNGGRGARAVCAMQKDQLNRRDQVRQKMRDGVQAKDETRKRKRH